jgi:hypothetical protein
MATVDGFLKHLKGLWWLLLPLLLWIVRVEMRLGPDGFSRKDAMAMEERIEFHVSVVQDQKYQNLKEQLTRIEIQARENGQSLLRHVESHNDK